MTISKSQQKRLKAQHTPLTSEELEKTKKREAEVSQALLDAKRQMKEDQLLVIQAVSAGIWLDRQLVEGYNFWVDRVEKLTKELMRLNAKIIKEFKL